MAGFNFGGSTTQTTTAPTPGFSMTGNTGGQTGFSFGAPRPPGSTVQPITSTSSGTGGFNFGQPAGPTTSTTSGGFSFGQPTTSTTSVTGGFVGTPVDSTASTKAPPTLPGFPFGASQPASSSGFNFSGLSQPASTAPSQPASSSGFNFGRLSQPVGGLSQPVGGLSQPIGGLSQPASTVPSQPASSSGFNFGGLSQPTSTGPSTTGFSLTVTSTAATSGVSTAGPATVTSGFRGVASTSANLVPTVASTATTSTGFAGFGLTATTISGFGSGLPFSGSNTTGQSSTGQGTYVPAIGSSGQAIGSSGQAIGTSAQKQMTFRQLEETINKWSTELEEQEKYFLDQATQVNAWDRIVLDNGEKIIQLNEAVEKVKLDQQKLDHELDFVHSQQRELEDLLMPLEKSLDSLPAISYQQHADVEREHTYMLAESLDAQMKRMGQDLKEIIERLNSNNSKPEGDDPVQQITKILNAHVVSLMWVDRNTANVQKRIIDISRQMDSERREQERNFRLAYS